MELLTDICIEKMDRGYVRQFDIYIYKNKTDRDLALDHSKKVASGLQYLISHNAYPLRGMEETPLKPDAEYKKPALEHLRTAYREIYDCFIEAEENRKKEAEEESTFTEFAEHLIMQVLNGTPLMGRCNLCPRVVTMRSSLPISQICADS